MRGRGELNRKRFITAVWCVMFYILISSSIVSAAGMTLNPIEDGTLVQDDFGSFFQDGTSFAEPGYIIDPVGSCNSNWILSEKAYLKFDLSGVTEPITSAKLRIYITRVTGSPWLTVSSTEDTWTANEGWTEGLDPAFPGARSDLVTQDPSLSVGWKEYDVTGFVSNEADQIVSFLLTGKETGGDDEIFYASSEDTNYPPELVITYLSQSAAISSATSITESALLGTVPVDVTLTGETFADGMLDSVNFTLTNVPAGVSIASVTYNSPTSCTLNLTNTIDFDSDYTMGVTIGGAELTGGTDLTAGNTLAITATPDVEYIEISSGAGIVEESEDGAVVTVALIGGTFADPIHPANWTVTNLPTGVSVGSIVRKDGTTVEITLSGNRTVDYDTDLTDLTVSCTVDEYVDSTGGITLTDNTGVTFVAVNDGETISIADDGMLNEGSEDGEVITVTLDGGTFADPIHPANWSVTNLPIGVSVGGIVRKTGTTVEITLSGNRTVDYDSDLTNLTVSCTVDEYMDSTGGSTLVDSTGVTFVAVNDGETISITDDGTLMEGTENGEVITVTLDGGTFADPIHPVNWSVTNLPTGVSVGSVVRKDGTTVEITLSGNRTVDYDSDLTNLTVNCTIDEYVTSTGDTALEAASGVTFQTNNDAEFITITDDGLINEGAEDGEVITVTLAGGTFSETITPANWTVMNLPTGVNKGTVSRVDDTTVEIGLVGNRTLDYDTNLTNLAVSCTTDEYVDSVGGVALEATSGVTFTAVNDIETLNLADDGLINEGAEDGEVITATISGGTFADPIHPANWTVTNLPAGVTKGTVTRIDETTVEISLVGNRTADYDVNITDVTVSCTADEYSDSAGLALTANTGVTLLAGNDAPTDIQISGQAVLENAPVGVGVGTLTAVDDPGDTHAFSLVAGIGDTDNQSFVIYGNDLATQATFDFEVKNSYSVRIKTVDSNGSSLEKAFVINILDANDLPEAIDGQLVVTEDTSYTFAIADFGYQDQDQDSLAKIMLTSLPTQGSLELDGVAVSVNQEVVAADLSAGKLTYIPVPGTFGLNYATIGFKVSDGTGFSGNAAQISLDVVEFNDPPQFAPIDPQVVNEGETLEFIVSGTDEETPVADLILGVTNLPTGAQFDEQTGRFSWTPGYSDAGEYLVTFTLSDGDNVTEKVVTITVLDVPLPSMVFEMTDQFAEGDTLEAGEMISYQMVIKNIGAGELHNAKVIAAIPSNTEYVANSTKVNGVNQPDEGTRAPFINGILVHTAGQSEGTILTGAGNLVTVEYQVRTLDTLVPGSKIINQATLYGVGGGSKSIQPVVSDDPATEAKSDQTQSVLATDQPILDAKKEVQDDNGGQVENGDLLTYSIIVSNVGAGKVSDVVLTDQVPEGTVFIGFADNSAQEIRPLAGQVIADTGEIQFDFGEISGQTSKSIAYQVQVQTDATSTINIISSQGVVSSAELPDQLTDNDGNTSNGAQPTEIAVGNYPVLDIGMTLNDLNGGEVVAGDELEYQIVLNNSGTAPAADLQIMSLIPAGIDYLAGSTTVNGLLVADVANASPLVAGLAQGVISQDEQVIIKYRGQVSDTVSLGDQIQSSASYTATARAEDTGLAEAKALAGSTDVELASIQIGGTPGRVEIRGAMVDASHAWTVDLYRNTTLITSTIVSEGSEFIFKGLQPAADYRVLIKHPETGVGYAEEMVGELAAGVVAKLALDIAPSGVIYDSMARTPVAGAIVTIVGPEGTPIPDDQLLPGQQNQQVAADGWYKFDLQFSKGAVAGAYRLEVTPPAGYNFPSALITPALDPEVEAFTVPAGGETYQVVEGPELPQADQETTYYLSFNQAAGDPMIIHNYIPVDLVTEGVLQLKLTADKKQVAVGDFIIYTMEISNEQQFPIGPFSVENQIPAGFTYLAESSRLNGTPVEPVNDGSLIWKNLSLDGNSILELKYVLVVGTGVSMNQFSVNRAVAIDEGAGTELSNSAEEVVTIVGEPIFDRPMVIGKVFIDKNGDGLQQFMIEPGVANVGLVTVSGQYIRTDEYGRFHIDVDQMIEFGQGMNLIVKLDETTLPEGFVLLTENPQLIRLMGGLIQKMNFTVKVESIEK